MGAGPTGTMAVTTPDRHPDRSRPPITSSHPTPALCQWFSWRASALDRRSAPRLALRFFGAVLARGRRTVTTWIRAAKLGGQYQSCYVAVAAAGKRKAENLVDRSGSPWDKESRRPSHADKRRAWRRALLGEEIRAVMRLGVTEEEIQAAADRLLSLAA